MATIKFYGSLKQYGDKFKINADTAAQALNCLYLQIKGLKQEIIEGYFRVRINGQDMNNESIQFGLHANLPKNAVVHVIPKIVGSKNGGIFNFVLGAALFTLGFFAPVTWGAWGVGLMSSGAGMMLSGVAQMLTKTPTADVSNSESQNKSTSFSSLSNTIAQGSPVPLIYGKIMVGSKVLSQGIETLDTGN